MQESILDSMRSQIVKDFTAAWALNDEAHRIFHFHNVEKCGNEINARLNLGYDPTLIMLVAHFHDMFAWSRVNHEVLSSYWVNSTDYPIIANLTDEDRKQVMLGCLQHRASFKGTFSSLFSRLMNSADRELPGDVEAMVERAVQFRMAKGFSREDAMKPAIDHIKEKYGDGGYGLYTDLYIKAFGDELTEQRRIIANL